MRPSITHIAPTNKYPKVVIPAEAGIQRYYWMPDRVRHDEAGYLIAGLIQITPKSRTVCIWALLFFGVRLFSHKFGQGDFIRLLKPFFPGHIIKMGDPSAVFRM